MEKESRNSQKGGGSDTNKAPEETLEDSRESGLQGAAGAYEVDAETVVESGNGLPGSTDWGSLGDTRDDSARTSGPSVKVPDISRTQRPKKKKRRQQGSMIVGGSLQALLHAEASEGDSSQSDSSDASEESRRGDRRSRKRKSSASKSRKKSHSKYKAYIHDEAEEDDEDTRGESHERPSRRKRESPSSSDEEEDDEDGYDELRDFIADEVEEDGVDDSLVYRGPHMISQLGGDGEGGLHGPSVGLEVDQESSGDDDDDEILRGGLEEDDLALIEENTGIRIGKGSQKHRLKKLSDSQDSPSRTLLGRDAGDLEDLLFSSSKEEGGVQEEDSSGRLGDVGPTHGFDSENSEDADDWMVDDMDERGGRGDEFNMIQSVFGDYDTVMDILMNKATRSKELAESSAADHPPDHIQASKSLKTSGEYNTDKPETECDHHGTDAAGDTDEDLFGEGAEREEGEVRNIQDRMSRATLHGVLEQAELQGRLPADFDAEVKHADIPERLHLLYASRWRSLENGKVDKEELQKESVWISRRFLQTYPELFKEEQLRRAHNFEFKTSFPYVQNGGVIQMVSSAVYLVLDWLLNEKLDIPYISLHKMHLVQPPLNDFLLGKIIFLDSVYYKLKLSMEGFRRKLLDTLARKPVSDVLALAESHQVLEDHVIQALLSVSGLQETVQFSHHFESSRDVDNIRYYLVHHIDTPRFRQIEENWGAGDHHLSAPSEHARAGQTQRKLRRNYVAELFDYIEMNELFKVWSPYIVSPYVVSLYLRSFTYPQFHCSTPTGPLPGIPKTFSLVPPAGPLLDNSKTALYKWLERLVRQDNPTFTTGEKILESLIIYESRRLASFPGIRAKIFDYFLSNACITTVTTVKGEKTLSPNGVFWLASRLFRKPINTLLPGTYLALSEEVGPDSQSSNTNSLFDGCLCSEMLELERRGLVEVVVHPLCIDDPAPWRGSDGEARIKGRFLHEVGLLESGVEFETSGTVQKSSLPTPILNRFDQELRMYMNSDNIDNRIVRNVLDELKYGYVSISGSVWNKHVQIPILHRLIEKELFPSFRNEVLTYLKTRSQEYISELCSLSLQKRLRVLPPKRPAREESSGQEGQSEERPGEHQRGDSSESEEDLDVYSGRAVDSDDERFVSRRSRGQRWRGASGANVAVDRGEYNTSWGLNVISCVVERARNGFKVCVVSLDIFGELRDFLVLDHLLGMSQMAFRYSGDHQSGEKDGSASLESQRFEEDMENLIKFTKMYFPHYVCVGISDRKSLDLGSLWGTILRKARRKEHKFAPGLLFVSMDVSRALVRRSVSSGLGSSAMSRSSRGGMQSEYPMYVHLAVSVGRLVQNPLAEQLQLWEDSGNETESELCAWTPSSGGGARDWFNPITCLRLHRFQDSVDPKMLQFHLLLAIRSVVASLGVQVNRMKGHSHLQSPLQFVSGLGPRKAKLLANYLDNHSGAISARSQLRRSEDHRETHEKRRFDGYDLGQDEQDHGGCLTKSVYSNARVFLRVDEESYNEKEFNKSLNIFDVSRLSEEEDKELVLTILGNIREQTSEDAGSGGRQRSREKDETVLWTWISKRSSKLETLDLEAYAKLMYENQKRPRLLPYLNRMIRELKKPYDCSFISREFRGVEKSRQLRESLEISREDLFVGCEITCRITGVFSNPRGPSKCPVSLWFDQYNMKAVLEDFEALWGELLDELPKLKSVSFDALFKVNTPLQAIVTSIDFSQHCVHVVLSQGKVCSVLNYMIDGVWRQQQYRLETVDRHRYEGGGSGGGSQTPAQTASGGSTDPSHASMNRMAVQEYQRNDFNLLQDDLSALTWTDIRHFSFILFKRNLNVLSTSSGISLGSGSGSSEGGELGDRPWERDNRGGGEGRYYGTIIRTIHHPNFRSWDHEQIIEYMRGETVPLGEVIIKSVPKYIDKLSMYVKVCENPFMFKIMTIDEFDQRLPGELGGRLRVDESDYSDIDQILIQYVHPLKVHLLSMFNHPKYRSNMGYQNLVTELLVESSTSGNSIVWGITMDRQIPCRFHLVSVPPNSRVGSSGARIHFEDGIYVSNKGFQLWRRSDNTLRKLLNWWKTDGFFKRSKHLEDYKRYKEEMVRRKQGKAVRLELDSGLKKSGSPSPPRSSYYYGSSGGGSGHQSQHLGGYQSSRYHNEGFGSYGKTGGGGPQYSSSHSYSGDSRKLFHGYPTSGGSSVHHGHYSSHHHHPPVPEHYEAGFQGNYSKHSRR